MFTFVHPALLWGLAAVSLPVIIHLIHMVRHRRIEWAAMEFLLQSQKRNRTWIMLRQFLLLLARMTAIAAIVVLVAQMGCSNQLAGMLGGTKTHHIVLLDDSFSMSDRWGDTSAFQSALQAVERIGERAAAQNSAQLFTLLRFSNVSRQGGETKADLLREPVGGDFKKRLAEITRKLNCSETDAGPEDALEAVERVIGEGDDTESRLVYLVSDFRATEWDNADNLKKRLQQLTDAGVRLQLISCADKARPNLAITNVGPLPGTQAAGVALPMEVAVANYGADPVRDVAVQLKEDQAEGTVVKFAEIAPGQTAYERFGVFFPTAGPHRIAAELVGADAVATDNRRFCVVNLPVAVPVLVIDGDPKGGSTKGEAFFINLAFTPGGSVNTGIKPRFEAPRFLRDEALDSFSAIYLVNIDRLDDAEIAGLERYAKGGGGVVFYLGPQTSADFVNKRLYRDGQGIFPLPLFRDVDLLVDRQDKAPDLLITRHPLFDRLAGQRNSILDMIVVEHYFAAARDWNPAPDSTTRVVARLRTGVPLIVEQKFGQGRVLAVLTSVAPSWNNIGRTPCHEVLLLQMQAYLSERPEEMRLVGSPLKLDFDKTVYQPEVRFISPAAGDAQEQIVPGETSASQALVHVTLPSADTRTSGIYQAQLSKLDGASELREFAFNVSPKEGDLKLLDGPQLATRLAGVTYQLQTSAELAATAGDAKVANVSDTPLYMFLLIALLLGEQVLAYSASYHAPVREAAA